MASATTPPRFFAAPPLRVALSIGLSLAVAWVAPDLAAAENDPQIQSPELQGWVEALGSESFHRRQEAARRLRDHAMQVDAGGEAVATALRTGLADASMEIRIASRRLLQAIELSHFDHQIDQLLNPRVPPDRITIAGWASFSEMTGTDFAARCLFSRLALRHHEILGAMESPLADDDPPAADLPDPYTLRSDDAVSWALVLLIDSHGRAFQPTGEFSKVTIALSNPSTGPNLHDSHDTAVLRRMISHWIGAHPGRGTLRQRILIAMRYACDQRAGELCDRVLADPDALPSSQVTAMLAAAVLQRPNLRSQLVARLSDDRTAHVWHLIATRQTKIRTQVRDVALALMVHLHQTDPREVGFKELQADPLLIFRDHSLGFASDEARTAAHQRAAKLFKRDPAEDRERIDSSPGPFKHESKVDSHSGIDAG